MAQDGIHSHRPPDTKDMRAGSDRRGRERKSYQTTTSIIMIMMVTLRYRLRSERKPNLQWGISSTDQTKRAETKRGCRIKTVSRVAYELITGRKNPLLHTYIIAHNCMLCEDSSDCGWDCCYSTLCRYQCLISCHRRRPREIILVNRRISRRIRNGGGYAGC